MYFMIYVIYANIFCLSKVPADSPDGTDTPNPAPTAPPSPCPASLNPAALPRAESTSQHRPYGRRPRGDFKGGRGGWGRGSRRGRGGPASHRTAEPVADRLSKLGLSPATDGSLTKCRRDTQSRDVCVEPREHSEESVKPGVEECITPSDRDSPGPEDPNVSTEAVQPLSSDQQHESESRERGRRRNGPHGRHERDAARDHSGSVYHYNRGRGHRARGTGFSSHYRGRGKGFQQRTESDFRKEEVL